MGQKITRVRAYQAELALREGAYIWSGGRSVTAFDTTIVGVETDAGLVGWGEVTPLGATYLPAYPAGARRGIETLAPHLIGADPTRLDQVNRLMDAAMLGHPYVKSALDMACWDILGKTAGLPVSTLLGGRYGEDIALYRSLPRDTPEAMAQQMAAYREEGFKQFQLKVGSTVEEDTARIRAVAAARAPGDGLVADANRGWLQHEALRVVRAVRDLDVYIEQPCASYEECLVVRRATDHPMVLDECIDSLAMLLRAQRDGAMDALNIKLSKYGGLTRARQIRDLCVGFGIAVTIEDAAATDIASAAVAHLAHSTPEELRLSVTIANVKLAVRTATGAPQAVRGRTAAPSAPGLGVEANLDVLGDPIFEIG